MPGCCVLSCKNSYSKGFRLFPLPSIKRNSERRKVWLSLINRPNCNESLRICEVHFSECQFEHGRQDGRKLLRPAAVPDLLVARDVNCAESSSKRKCTEHEIKPEPVDDESAGRDLENDSVDEEIEAEFLHEDQSSIDTIRKKLKAALRKCRQYERKLKQQMNSPLENIFNQDQLNVLKNGTCRGGTWTDDTINKGLKLYLACGTKGYEEILCQQLPYPSIRTLQHRISNLKFREGTFFRTSQDKII